ncbi:M4 family metallopeptidase [Nocardia mexicana]|uniref:Neutral metalloproteinase n=1 Tax=Nocardia mexicana TaxID=279262 RepID=A0A370H011_9NOCA|nr:M4 family metallopeptidase [Nocardia mexicana]RDI49260.1 Zn-dependent metalloprotease [Nocardia mexicana]
MKTCLCGLWVASLVLLSAPLAAQPPVGPSLATAPKRVQESSRGAVRQIVPDRPIAVPGGRGLADPATAATAHSADIKQLFGAAADLVVTTVAGRAGGSTVRLGQRVGAIPVHGAGVALALRPDGSLQSATGALSERIDGSYPSGGTEPAEAARRTAVGKVAELSGLAADALRVRSESAAWFDPSLVDGERPDRVAVPAYRYDIRARAAVWRVFVAAVGGAVLDALPAERALDRVVCDADSQGAERTLAVPCGAAGSYPVVRTEGGPRVPGNEDADKVYDWMGDTEDFYRRHTALGGLTDLIGIEVPGSGKALRATVRVCAEACPYANAYWTDEQGFVIGSAVLGLDVVAHELTHGVTERTSGLNYVNESGAINESMSDVFGEFTELAGKRGRKADRWKIGNGTDVGVIRDMRSPRSAADPQPETYKGPGWVPATHSDRDRAPDNGGVHTNSGVGNRLAALITDGGTLGGRKVDGIGLDKAAALYWSTQTQLFPSADYPALASTLITVCHNNIDDKIAGFTAPDCAHIQQAVEAVRIPLLRDRT